ncbi:hypothetical protein P9759_13900, partial [Heyndrickxia coagulans]|nr:hypothetical protein [Heyndrickxia coagulans]
RDSCGKSGPGETPQPRYERGGSPAARGKRVNFARINTPVINLYESVQKECLGIPIFKPYREKLDTYNRRERLLFLKKTCILSYALVFNA